MRENADSDEFFFTGNQHKLGDSAFGIHSKVVPNYKKPHADLPENQFYNLQQSKPRLVSEHTIGIVKERFLGLREIRINLNKKKGYEASCEVHRCRICLA